MDKWQHRPFVAAERTTECALLYVRPGHTEQDEESVRRNELIAASFDGKQSMNQETGWHFVTAKWSQRGRSEAVRARVDSSQQGQVWRGKKGQQQKLSCTQHHSNIKQGMPTTTKNIDKRTDCVWVLRFGTWNSKVTVHGYQLDTGTYEYRYRCNQ